MSKPEVKIIDNIDFSESYNSSFRVVVPKLVNEKYARKLAQDFLKSHSFYGINLNTLYMSNNGIKSQQEDRWIFGTTLPAMMFMTTAYERLYRISEHQ
jgi:hypothetical protein